jgi:polar amino acid transport system ATP-binding protein
MPLPTEPAAPEAQAEPVANEAITFSGVSKRWGDNVVLDGLDLTVSPGEKVSIIGPSGSGKTTILRVLMTLETPDEGLVTVHGETLWDARDGRKPKETKQRRVTRRKVGMVFQQFNLFPHMTAIENVMEAPIRVLGMSRDEARERAKHLLDTVGLERHLDHKPPQLSGGQQQRVAIARACAMRPKVLLFDEPTSALDPELIGEVLNTIRDLALTTDITMLLVTHEMRFAADISDRILMFDSGAVVEAGPPAQVLKQPEHERTRKFLHAVLDH